MDTSDFDFPDTAEHPHPSTFEYVTKLFLPGLSLIALIINSITTKRANISWTLLGLTGTLLLIGFWRPISIKIRTFIGRLPGHRAAKKSYPEFKAFVHNFGEFVDTQRQDTLHYIVEREAYQGRTDQFMRHGVPDIEILNTYYRHLIQRVDKPGFQMSRFREQLSEFNDIVSLFDSYCVVRVFEHSPQEFRERLTPEVKRSLNSFQQRFAAFLDDFTKYGKRLVASTPALGGPSFTFWRPRPL